MSSNSGRLFVLSGPSGSGKSSICSEVSRRTGIDISISATTRKPRAGEEDGVHYIFMDRSEFEEKAAAGWFYEYAEVYEEFYGTPRRPIEKGLAQGRDFLLDIDIQGAESVRKACKCAVLIFVVPPDIATLRKRLEGRGTESGEELELRLSRTLAEMEKKDEYDYTVANRDLDGSVSEVMAIIDTEKANGREL